MKLVFYGGSELVQLSIDRKNKKLKVATSKTGYKLIDTSWKELFDKGKEKFQEKRTDKMNNKDFRNCIIAEMSKQGYHLK